MADVFNKEIAEKLYGELFNGRMMHEENSKKDEPSKKAITSKQMKVGEWFRIDRDVIAKNLEKIRRECNEEGDIGKAFLKIMEEFNKIADENPDQYPCIIETYILKHDDWKKQNIDMRKQVIGRLCDEIICYLEIQMRICNGESVHTLLNGKDAFPLIRIIQFRSGEIGCYGSGGILDWITESPANIYSLNADPFIMNYLYVPYVFRRVLS